MASYIPFYDFTILETSKYLEEPPAISEQKIKEELGFL